jgi:hypothetical protein
MKSTENYVVSQWQHEFDRLPPDASIATSDYDGLAGGVTEDGITENAITLIFSRTGKRYNRKII